MQSVQLLADEIADAYLRFLHFHNGNHEFKQNNITGTIIKENLAGALVDTAILMTSEFRSSSTLVEDAHKYLTDFIDVFAKPYQITEEGLRVITILNIDALNKGNVKPNLM